MVDRINQRMNALGEHCGATADEAAAELSDRDRQVRAGRSVDSPYVTVRHPAVLDTPLLRAAARGVAAHFTQARWSTSSRQTCAPPRTAAVSGSRRPATPTQDSGAAPRSVLRQFCADVAFGSIVLKKYAIPLHTRNKVGSGTGKLLTVLEIFIAHLGRGSGKAAIPDFFNTTGANWPGPAAMGAKQLLPTGTQGPLPRLPDRPVYARLGSGTAARPIRVSLHATSAAPRR